KGWMHYQDMRPTGNACDRCDIAEKNEIELVVECRVDYVGRTASEERVAIGWRTHDPLGGESATGTHTILDDEWLAELLRQPLADQTREDVARAARGKTEDDVLGLRPSEVRDHRQRGSAGGEMQKISAGKFHFELSLCPSHHSITSSARASSDGGTSSPSAL